MVRIFMNQTLYQFDIPYFKEYFLPLNSFRTSVYCTVTVNKVKFQKKKLLSTETIRGDTVVFRLISPNLDNYVQIMTHCLG